MSLTLFITQRPLRSRRFFSILYQLGILFFFECAPLGSRADSVDTVTPIYLYPPNQSNAEPSSSFDFWWPYPAWSAPPTPSPSPTPTPSPASSSIDSPSLSSTVASSSSVTSSPLFATSTALSALSSLSGPSSGSSSSSSSSSTSSLSIISITATTSPDTNTAVSHSFKVLYLTPLFVILGVVLGATVTGCIYAAYARRRAKNQNQNPISFSPPRSRSMLVELGGSYHPIENDDDLGKGPGEDPRQHGPPYTHQPSPSVPRMSALASLSRTLHQIIPSPSSQPQSTKTPLTLTTPLTDRDDLHSHTLRPLSTSRKDVYGRAIASPAGPSAFHDGFEDVPLHAAGESEGEDDEEVIYGRRSHGRIRRRIAERLRLGSRRNNHTKAASIAQWTPKEGSVPADEAFVRRVSGAEVRTSEGGLMARNIQPIVPNQLALAKYSLPGPRIASGRHSRRPTTRLENDGVDTLHDDMRHPPAVINDSEISPLAQSTPASRSRLLPKDPSALNNQRPSKLRPKSRIHTTSISAEIQPSSPSDIQSPMNRTNGPRFKTTPYHRAKLSHPIRGAPEPVLSPPANPDLFFADPVLSQYAANGYRSSGQRSEAGVKGRRIIARSIPTKTGDEPKGPIRPQRKLHRSHNNQPPEGVVGSSPYAPSTTSSLIPPARARAMMGQVDAIVKESWSTRNSQDGLRGPTGLSESSRDYHTPNTNKAGHVHEGIPRTESPSLAAAKTSGIQRRLQLLKEKELGTELV